MLLYLIRREEIDIYDIPISSITRQYLEYIELMQELDLEVAGEFILMAATLIGIKARMLLPRNEENPEEEEEDPRNELVRQLLEYKRYKGVAESLTDLESEQSRLYPRVYFDWEKEMVKEKPEELTPEEVLKDISLFDLLTAFQKVLKNRPKKNVHQVGEVGATIEEQLDFIVGMLEEKERFGFSELMTLFNNRVTIVVTFIALLELIRTHRILVQQADTFDEIWIVRRA